MASRTASTAVFPQSIAVGESWKDKTTGEKQERTEWVNLVAFERTAEIVAEYLKKGSQVYVSGKMQTRKWQDKEGNDRYTTEVVVHQMQMLGGRSSGEGSEKAAKTSNPKAEPEQQEFPDANDPF